CLEREPEATSPAAVIVSTKPEFRADALTLARELRSAGLRIDSDLRGTSLKSQMRRADKSGARYALIVGEAEVAENAVQLKPLRGDGEQRLVARGDLASMLGGVASKESS
ncbi:MAG: His/Gly/Thr/Pro-type tRNA ligase C-terminal domain-containing protein, partial [Myxococcota bacterium]